MPHANNCPFLAGGMLTNSRYFVGRKRELAELVTSMTGAQPVSVNVHGERRMGKSFLLYHFHATWPERVADVSRYAVAYLDLQGESCPTVAAFYQALANTLLSLPGVRSRQELLQPLAGVSDRQGFVQALEQWHAAGVRPVLCLDEFESLLNYGSVFDDSFFDNLRSLLNRGLLMLVITTLEPLGKLKRQLRFTSNFFNLGHHCRLDGLSPDEVDALLARSLLDDASGRACLSLDEQKLVRDWGGDHPYVLQLAAHCLYHARQDGGMKRARECFDREVNLNPSLGWWWRWNNLPVLGTATALLARMGRTVLRVGSFASRVTEVLMGLAILVIAGLVIVGVIPWEKLLELIP